MSNHTHADAQSRMDERDRHDSTLSNYATQRYIEERFGEAVTFCIDCGLQHLKKDEAGDPVCETPGCELSVIAFNPMEDAA